MEWLGVDVGAAVLAVDSDYNQYASKEHLSYYVRPNKDTRRHDVQAGISAAKAIVELAERTGRGVAIENLRFPPRHGKRHRRAWLHVSHKIAFYCSRKGVPLKRVNPAYTSQTCPNCDFVSRENRRQRNRFKCLKCGFADHADVVGARNIKRVAQGTFPGSHLQPLDDSIRQEH